MKTRNIPPSRKGCTPWNKGLKGAQVAWNKGKTLSEEHKKSLSDSHLGNEITEAAREKLRKYTKELRYNYKGGLPNCIECSKTLARREALYCRTCAGRVLRSGSKSYSWKGGVTPLIRKVRNCVEYKIWRTAVYERDKYTCVMCGTRSGNGKAIVLHVDHYPRMFKEIFYDNNISSYEEAVSCADFWDVNNGRTLCIECHRVVTKEQWKTK